MKSSYILDVEGQNLELPGPNEKKCSICGKQFLNKRSVGRHIREQHERRSKLECQICGTIIGHRKFQLLKHMAKFHNITDVSDFE